MFRDDDVGLWDAAGSELGWPDQAIPAGDGSVTRERSGPFVPLVHLASRARAASVLAMLQGGRAETGDEMHRLCPADLGRIARVGQEWCTGILSLRTWSSMLAAR